MKRPFLLFIFLLVLSSSLVAAGKCFWQADGVLISGINGMGLGDLVTDMRGGAYSVTGDLDSVYVIRIDKNGNLPWGLKGVVVDTQSLGSFQMNTLGVSDGKGGVIVVWNRLFPWGYNLYCQRIDSSGNKMWGASARSVTVSDSSQEDHLLVPDGEGGVILTWQQYRLGQYDIYAQRIDSNGVKKWGSSGVTVCNTIEEQQLPRISRNNIGDVLICWWDSRNDVGDVYGQRITRDGVVKWINNGIAIADTDNYQTSISIEPSQDYSWIISWGDKRSGFGDVYAQQVDSNGNNLWQKNGIVVCSAIGDQSYIRSISDGVDGMIISWMDKRNINYDIFSQRIDKQGNIKWSADGENLCNDDSSQEYQCIVSDNRSGAIISWYDDRSGNNDIYVQRVDSVGNVKWGLNGMPVCTATNTQERPKMISSDSGRAIIAWPDGRSGYWRAYAQMVGDDPNGVEGRPGDSGQWAAFRLEQNYPNPFKQSTVIRYQLTGAGPVKLAVYNIAGQLVKTLVDDPSPNALLTLTRK